MYENIKKSFNATPRFLTKVAAILCAVSLALVVIKFPMELISNGISAIGSVVLGVVVNGALFYIFWKNCKAQDTLATAFFGKELSANYGLSGADLEATIKEIDEEMKAPVYFNDVKKDPFAITKNWMIGVNGALERAVAIKLSDCAEFERLNRTVNRGVGSSTLYYIVPMTKKNKKYYLVFLDEAKRDEAAAKLAECIEAMK